MKEFITLTPTSPAANPNQLLSYPYIWAKAQTKKIPFVLVPQELIQPDHIRCNSQLYYDLTPFSEVGPDMTYDFFEDMRLQKSIGSFKIAKRAFTPVQKSDWSKIVEIQPHEAQNIETNVVLTASEFEFLSLGVEPIQMEDKWFIYTAGNQIHFHRSWTGIEVFRATFQQTESGNYRFTQLISNTQVDMTPEQKASEFQSRVKSRLNILKRLYR